MKGIYLAACKARHKNHNIVYQDIDLKYKPDILGDMLNIDLTPYDFVIATPPCNWWSKANPYWYRSKYAWKTINLLPLTIIKLVESKKLFIIENVINRKRFELLGIYRLCSYYNLYVYEVGRHTYITNIEVDLNCEQHQDFKIHGVRINNDGYNQGGSNVAAVIEKFLKHIEGEKDNG